MVGFGIQQLGTFNYSGRQSNGKRRSSSSTRKSRWAPLRFIKSRRMTVAAIMAFGAMVPAIITYQSSSERETRFPQDEVNWAFADVDEHGAGASTNRLQLLSTSPAAESSPSFSPSTSFETVSEPREEHSANGPALPSFHAGVVSLDDHPIESDSRRTAADSRAVWLTGVIETASTGDGQTPSRLEFPSVLNSTRHAWDSSGH